jgi:hypothetical protein
MRTSLGGGGGILNIPTSKFEPIYEKDCGRSACQLYHGGAANITAGSSRQKRGYLFKIYSL